MKKLLSLSMIITMACSITACNSQSSNSSQESNSSSLSQAIANGVLAESSSESETSKTEEPKSGEKISIDKTEDKGFMHLKNVTVSYDGFKYQSDEDWLIDMDGVVINGELEYTQTPTEKEINDFGHSMELTNSSGTKIEKDFESWSDYNGKKFAAKLPNDLEIDSYTLKISQYFGDSKSSESYIYFSVKSELSSTNSNESSAESSNSEKSSAEDAYTVDVDALKKIEDNDDCKVKVTKKEILTDVYNDLSLKGNDALSFTVSNNDDAEISNFSILVLAYDKDNKAVKINTGFLSFGKDKYINKLTAKDTTITSGKTEEVSLRVHKDDIEGLRCIVLSYTKNGKEITNDNADKWYKNTYIGKATTLD